MYHSIHTKNKKISRGSCWVSFVFRCTLVDAFHLLCSVRQLQKWSFTKTVLIDTWWEVPIIKCPGQCWLGNTCGFAAEVCWVALSNRLVSWRNVNLRRDFLPTDSLLNCGSQLGQSNNKINHTVINPIFGLNMLFCENGKFTQLFKVEFNFEQNFLSKQLRYSKKRQGSWTNH